MGGEVTAQSDLYSLGCMPYEMVTGRPLRVYQEFDREDNPHGGWGVAREFDLDCSAPN